MTNTAPITTVRTSELQVGDVVLAHGMRLLIRTPLTSSAGNRGGNCWGTYALVVNEDEAVRESGIPRHWLYSDDSSTRLTADPTWRIQGNDVATWTVVRSAA